MNAFPIRLVAAFAVVMMTTSSLAYAQVAPNARYVTGSGTVYDTKTKLTWQQIAPTTTYTWAAAKTYCQGLGASLGGAGWRLPTVKELQSILDYTRSAPMIDPGAFPATASSSFWSSTPVMGETSSAWEVFFDYGVTTNIYVTDSSYVRCVR